MSMQIGATTWGQQWLPPANDVRAAGVTGPRGDVPGSEAAAGFGGSIDARVARLTGERSDVAGPDAAAGVSGSKDCRTCKSRKYSDRSSDPTVTFQTPTSLSPEQASTAVRAHEQQHVVHEQARARDNGQRVVSQNVTIHSAICPECGRSYVSGGTTTTTTKPADNGNGYSSSGASSSNASGALVDRRY
jgi:hypothetical protein